MTNAHLPYLLSATVACSLVLSTPADVISTMTGLNPGGYWRYEESAGASSAVNEIAGGANAPISGAITTGINSSLNAANGFAGFGSTNHSFQHINDAASVVGTLTGAAPMSSDAGSVSLWFKVDTTQIGMMYYLGGSGNGFGEDNEIHLGLAGNGAVQLYLESNTEGGGAADINLLSSTLYNDGGWHHATAAWDASDVSLYIDWDGTTGEVLNAGRGSPLSGVTYTGAAARSGKPRENTRYFVGELDEIAVWNRALSSSETSSIYQAALVPEPATFGLLALGLLALRLRQQ